MEIFLVVKKANRGSRLSRVSIHTEYTIKLGSHCWERYTIIIIISYYAFQIRLTEWLKK